MHDRSWDLYCPAEARSKASYAVYGDHFQATQWPICVRDELHLKMEHRYNGT